MKLKILVGTVTNTAEYVAQAIEMDCADLVDEIEVVMMDGLSIDAFAEDALYLLCTSTYGAGDVPDNAQALYASLDDAPRYLGHVRYGVIALGDAGSHGATFAFGGRKFDERLECLGARRIGDIFTHDASDGSVAEEVATAWCRAWLPTALAQMPA
ncbi:flavodoxin domain-containing protein [Pseudorhodoferax sp. Leaf267]|uniref:flavodoxin domain-containing protein n=1 Tax=Pseudorhodoferax sp. Leaf267 TaxID=1736316 RepID=UPI00070009ED|nr:flavodoxin domain-containing protein [Pseudorhodoferax sp. Leaf267]KQP20053.1 nitric oxide synthase [Pseudorhodoferax sp. Leaf267]